MEQRQMFVWFEKYRPQTLADCILPKGTAATLAGILTQQDTPNLLLHGAAGTGKTTVALALTHQLDADMMLINASLSAHLDTLRNEVQSFASAVSMRGNRKFVILDEADYLPHTTQPALRSFMEEYAGICGFILTANYPSRIIPALQSRCSLVDFRIPVEEKATIATAFLKRAVDILRAESVVHDLKVVSQVVANYFPDFRRILNELQRFSSSGELSPSILAQLSDRDVTTLFEAIKNKDFKGLRKWLTAHEDMDEVAFYRMLSEQVVKRIDSSCLTEAIILMADYNARSGYAADKQLNNLAVLVELMKGGVWQ
jgi:DNA polymerase III delta prime subunit